MDFKVGDSSAKKQSYSGEPRRRGRGGDKDEDDEEEAGSSMVSYLPYGAAMLVGGLYGKHSWERLYDVVSNYGGVAQTSEYGKKAAQETF